MDEQLGAGELEEVIRQKEAHFSAVVLQSIGDIPDADLKPPENGLFICKLNPITEDRDLRTIFSGSGTVIFTKVMRNFKTGDSLGYAFIEFETKEVCEEAYLNMHNASIDGRRIHVDFIQSVSKLWSEYRRKEHLTGKGRGCFKCGSLDHMAKDCTGDLTIKSENLKYVLKDGNTQHGENENYEKVFDGETTDGSGCEKRWGKRVSDKDPKKRRVHIESENDLRYKGQDSRDTRSDESSHDNRSRGRDREDESSQGSRHGGSRRLENEEYETREKWTGPGV
ncbi:hypothetical protein C5167_028228 [Papaver somniferum]|nr:hypothetical protein C5167_028228 [Papaver somniferum]